MCGVTPAKCAELLLHDRAVLDTCDSAGWTETHQACRVGRVQHLEHLLFYGAEMNAQVNNGNTPLHVCAQNNQVRRGKIRQYTVILECVACVIASDNVCAYRNRVPEFCCSAEQIGKFRISRVKQHFSWPSFQDTLILPKLFAHSPTMTLVGDGNKCIVAEN